MTEETEAFRPSIVITYGWGLGTPGGIARIIRELGIALAARGASVTLVCVEAAGYTSFPRPKLDPRYRGEEIEADLARRGVRVVRVPPHPLHWYFDGRPLRRSVERLLGEGRVDVVLGFFNELAWLPDLLERHGARLGVIATWLSYRMALSPERQGKGLRRWWRTLGNRRFIVDTYRRAEVVFATSEFTQGELVDVLGIEKDRIAVTYLGINPAFFDVPRREPERITRIVFFGRIVREKGILEALEALARIARAGYDWTFRVMGSGNREHVAKVARELGIAERVEITDHLGDEALREELERAHLALLPSHSESFGLAIAEVQAAGLPVIAFRAGSVPEVVEDGVSGWLVPLRDVDALTARLQAALDDPAECHRIGLAARERASRLFRWERTAELVLERLRTIL